VPIGTLLLSFTLWFFRDPHRELPDAAKTNPALIIAPADGKIIEIVEIEENKYMNATVKRISIFLSGLNVHVNRNPIFGEVEYYSYNPGAYIIANHPKASELNENTFIGVRAVYGKKVAYKQMTGIMARRIVCTVKKGDMLNAGERFGMMKFGSRMDIFVPLNTTIYAQIGDKTRAGNTIIAELKEQ
jgi:phosphatidylserine decarboxylase